MKKIAKLFGLLLVAGALLTGCQQNVDIVTDDISLSSGKWDVYYKYTASETENMYGVSVKLSFTQESKGTISVSGDSCTTLSQTSTMSETMTFPEGTPQATLDAALAEAKEEISSATLNGLVISASETETATAAELEEMNKKSSKVSDFKKTFPEHSLIKTNKKKTEYAISYEKANSKDGVEVSKETWKATLKKQ